MYAPVIVLVKSTEVMLGVEVDGKSKKKAKKKVKKGNARGG